MVLLGFVVDEFAVQSQLPDDGIHLAKRELWAALEPAADEAIGVGRETGFQSSGAGIVGERRAVLAR